MLETLLLVLISALTAGVGAVAGLGGAILLVPILIISGLTAGEAAALGLLSVAAGSVAAGPRQLTGRLVNHRIGLTTELAATTGAIIGALVSSLLSDDFLVYMLAAAALAAALAGGRRKGLRNPPDFALGPDEIGERVGALGGAYPVNGGVAPYGARRLPAALSLMGLSGFITGTAGVGGGFIKTPTASEIMHVPTKVAAATTTFTVGITAAASLVVYALQGRIDFRHGSAVIFGSLLGAVGGAAVQSRLSPQLIRRGLSIVLVIVAILLVLR